ncbi:helix-turn-helix domain-containing protein [Erythrobacter sp. SCSIO 43205]|uniref:helix-turn-helix domain-containing protein n=1 Tax=Erythrobacter sp. SCSIO 43205 TaxID=2779361 RepID=UPI001CA9F9EB|nr:helix-turn-helix domain-containing protein [Erythrobacter sp. SCSIO 43205]UAB78240.1 helix-turn-helix domain-containing protein [Erythrobacter sp. SCSIO 43205]
MALKAHLEPLSTAQEGSVENRRHTRRSLTLITSGIAPNGAPANVTIHNLSAAGLLIETDLDLVPGDRLAIGLPDVGPVGAEIVWVSERLYGCAFEQALGEAALAASELAATPARIGVPLARKPNTPAPLPGFKARGGSFGTRLNRLRREKGLTLDQVATALGVSKPTVWAWEKGKANPIPERIEGIAEVLGVSAGELAENAPQGNRENLLAQCRLRIASEFETDPENVRIMIEV